VLQPLADRRQAHPIVHQLRHTHAAELVFGRALQDLPLRRWGGQAAESEAAQQAFRHRIRLSSLARAGRYDESMESELGAT